MQTKTPPTFTVPLGRRAHKLAEQFFVQHTKQKARQVYLNTLAVHAVEFYLKCMSIETDWETSDSYEPVMQTLLDTADLEVKDCGKLECRPLLAGAEVFQVPMEVWSDRIGYVAVEISDSMNTATLLGFVESVSEQEVPISQLRSLKELRMHLYQLRESSQENN